MKIKDINVGDVIWYVEDLWENVEIHESIAAFKTEKWLVLQSKDGYCYNITIGPNYDDNGFFMFSNELGALRQAKLLIEKQIKGMVEDASSYAKRRMTVEKSFVKQVTAFQKRIEKLSKKAK